MGRSDEYRRELRKREDWEPFLLEHSGLPGPRANLELMQAVVEEGSTSCFLTLLEQTPERAPSGSRGEFLALCGAAGLGKSIAGGEQRLWRVLRALASDPRWRVREGVAMALQRIGDVNSAVLLEELRRWTSGGLLEQRAVVAGLCEPRLLKEEALAQASLAILDELTAGLEGESTQSEERRVLRKALGYCWSVAIVARPEEGMRRFERWVDNDHPDIHWVIRENLRKKRLQKVDTRWVAALAERLKRHGFGRTEE